MLSKEVKLRRLINFVWRHTATSKQHREMQVSKQAYWRIARKLIKLGIDPHLHLKRAPFTPSGIPGTMGRRSLLQRAAVVSNHLRHPEILEEEKKAHKAGQKAALHEMLLEAKPAQVFLPNFSQEGYIRSVPGLTPEFVPPSFNPLIGVQPEFIPHQPEQFYTPPPVTDTQDNLRNYLVAEGMIGDNDEIPEDPPDGWDAMAFEEAQAAPEVEEEPDDEDDVEDRQIRNTIFDIDTTRD